MDDFEDQPYISDDRLDAMAALDHQPCDGRREDGEPCAKVAGHVGDCEYCGEWRI